MNTKLGCYYRYCEVLIGRGPQLMVHKYKQDGVTMSLR
jgi:hypothetical protein